ncbi:MAG: hypothetical protein QM391_02255 [Bacillota bacterium]|jgi:hypothetical protein|nr:hypothetical protein [Bacillota bacterium]MDI9414863.1 hypothetical protein [Bacillota bacterium]NLD13082.1 hypothetical protein [Bacillota bacterium]HAV21094.1 hypothetical protein [Bacillota bacterium]HCD41597.1 hypothetical protein [Bacillota bacterium]
MAIEGWLLLLIVAFLIGYIVGHRQGKVEGFREGAVFAPIEMRRATLEKGRCMICGAGVKRQRAPDDRTPAPSGE